MTTENPAFDKWWRTRDTLIKCCATREDLSLLAFTAGETNGIRRAKDIIGEYKMRNEVKDDAIIE